MFLILSTIWWFLLLIRELFYTNLNPKDKLVGRLRTGIECSPYLTE
ncbi:hypothetical protein NRI_0908 [Neorickettsia risticii str. Illinois]|uniref:Uncharacterized protein n=1 Tax=Neorickettsia risticii (strain Illinois) TaxID=434131 RepID=C6V656_NEORI|nr:hypothetical protein NRI_0908 [Neorickettsia risticii str. Illinois]